MTILLLLRHGETSWNVKHRIQGRTDLGLTEPAKQRLSRVSIPTDWQQFQWFSSPLKRAIETTALLAPAQYQIAPELIEMHWGKFEGMQLAEIETAIIAQQLNPAHGLDLLPPDGESPRMVGARLQRWILRLQPHAIKHGIIGITHKGVIRAALSLATGWSMQQEFQAKINWRLPLAFQIDRAGQLHLVQVNHGFKKTAWLPPIGNGLRGVLFG